MSTRSSEEIATTGETAMTTNKRHKLANDDGTAHEMCSLLNPTILEILLHAHRQPEAEAKEDNGGGHGSYLLCTKDLGRLLLCTSKRLTNTVSTILTRDNNNNNNNKETEDNKKNGAVDDQQQNIWKLLCKSHWGHKLAQQHLTSIMETPKDFFLSSSSPKLQPEPNLPPRKLKYQPSDYQLFVDIKLDAHCLYSDERNSDNEVNVQHNTYRLSKVYHGSDIPSTFFDEGHIRFDFEVPTCLGRWLTDSGACTVYNTEKVVLKRRDHSNTNSIETVLTLENDSEYDMHEQTEREFRFDSAATVLIDGQSSSSYARSLISSKYAKQVPLETHLWSEWELTDEDSHKNIVLINYWLTTYFSDPESDGWVFHADKDDPVRYAHILEALPSK